MSRSGASKNTVRSKRNLKPAHAATTKKSSGSEKPTIKQSQVSDVLYILSRERFLVIYNDRNRFNIPLYTIHMCIYNEYVYLQSFFYLQRLFFIKAAMGVQDLHFSSIIPDQLSMQ